MTFNVDITPLWIFVDFERHVAIKWIQTRGKFQILKDSVSNEYRVIVEILWLAAKYFEFSREFLLLRAVWVDDDLTRCENGVSTWIR